MTVVNADNDVDEQRVVDEHRDLDEHHNHNDDEQEHRDDEQEHRDDDDYRDRDEHHNDDENRDKNRSKNRSWVWQHAEYREVENIVTKMVEKRACCRVENCKWSILATSSSGITGAIANHLLLHDVRSPKKQQNKKNPIDKDLANYYLLKFIITGFLPFVIVENEAFKQ